MSATKDSWCYAEVEDADDWASADSREEAIAAAAAQAEADGNDEFCVAPAIRIRVEDLTVNISAEGIFDDIVDRNELPEQAHEWLLGLEAVKLELQIEKLVKKWLMSQHNRPNWYSVGKVETLKTKDYPETGKACTS